MENINSKEYLDEIKFKIMENLKKLPPPPTASLSNHIDKFNDKPYIDSSDIISAVRDKKEEALDRLERKGLI